MKHYKLHMNSHLKVLVVVWIDAETGNKAVHHELHVSILAASPPPERFGWVEQQSLVEQGGSCQVTEKQINHPDAADSQRGIIASHFQHLATSLEVTITCINCHFISLCAI